MRKYSSAPSSRSSRVRISRSIHSALKMHSPDMITPVSTQSNRAVCTAFSVSSCRLAPNSCATRTLTPAPIPIRNPVKSVTRMEVEPTDPMALELENLPTMATSAMLNSTCRICDSISGRLKIRIFFQREPLRHGDGSRNRTLFCFQHMKAGDSFSNHRIGRKADTPKIAAADTAGREGVRSQKSRLSLSF